MASESRKRSGSVASRRQTSGYSGTPLAKKLGIAPGARLFVQAADALIWVSWPKKAAGVPSDITEEGPSRKRTPPRRTPA